MASPTSSEILVSGNKSTIVRPMMAPAPIQQAFKLLEAASPSLALHWLNRLFAQPKRHRYPLEEKQLLAQASKKTHYLLGMPNPSWDFKPVVSYRWSTPNAQARVLLMHGWEGRATQFYAFVPALLAAGFDVLAVDAPAHGASPGRWSSLFHFSRALTQVVNGVGAVDAAITHSFGGPSLIHAMSEGLRVQKSVLISPPVRVTDYTQILCDAVGVSTALRERLHVHWQNKLGVMLNSLDAGKFAQQLTTRALVIHDLHDKEVAFSAGREIAEQWPNAQLITTTDLGHRRILKDENVVRQSMGFLLN